MRGLLVVCAVVAVVSAIPYKFDHDIKVNVYDVLKSLYAAAPLSYYLEQLTSGGEFKFTENSFQFYPEDEIKEFIAVYKPKGKDYLHGYYVRTEDVSSYDDEFFKAVSPIYDYLNSGEYYAFTPLAAKQIVPNYFNTALKKIFYDYYHDVDVNRAIPLVFLVPKSEVNKADLKNYILVAQYEVTKNAAHTIHSYFGSQNEKAITKRSPAYVIPAYYRAYPTLGYPYAYGYNTHLKAFPYYIPVPKSYVHTYPYY